MKKKVKRSTLMLLCLMVVLTLVSCSGETENFVRGTHMRDENISRNFEMLTLEDGSLQYHMEIASEDKDSDSLEKYEEQLLEIKNLVGKIEETAKKFSIEQKNGYTDIYFIENSQEGGIYFYDTVVLVDKSIIGTEQFNSSLICFLYDCEEWVGYGLNGYMNGVEADETFLKEYYSKEENIADLSLFGGKFYELNTNEEERKAVQETAISLFSYIAGKKDTKVLFDENSGSAEQIIEWKNEWLNERNGTAVYKNEREEIVRSLRFYLGNKEYPVRMYWNQCIFHLNDIVFLQARMENMSDFEDEILLALGDIVGIENYLYENLSKDLIKKIEANKTVCNCYFRDARASYRSFASYTDNINLVDIGAFAHEYTHIITGIYGNGEAVWLSEGLADYFGTVMFGRSKARYYAQMEQEIVQARYDQNSEVYKWGKKIDAQYFEWGGTYEEEGFDYQLLAMAQVYLVKTIPEFRDSKWMEHASLSKIYGSQIKNGTGDWTYEECELFTSYLIERFGIEEVIKLNFNYSNSTFEELFGDTLLNLHAEWEKEFLEECSKK